MEPRPVPIASTELSPEEIAARSFPTVRRGLDGEAVRHFLEEIARQWRAARAREAELRGALGDAEQRAKSPVLDDDTLTAAVGAETAKVLRAAREAAREMVANAESRAGELVGEAERLLAERAAAAEAEAERLLSGARRQAEALLEQARSECRTMVDEAREARRRILGDLGARRRELHVQLEQIRAAKDALIEIVEGTAGSVEQIRKRLTGSEEQARQAAQGAAGVAALLADEVPLEQLVSDVLAGPITAESELIVSAPFGDDPPAVEPDHFGPLPEMLTRPGPEPIAEQASEGVAEGGDAAEGPLAGERPADAEPLVVEGFLADAGIPTAEDAGDDGEQPGSEASAVDELFARIRASREQEVAEARSVLAPAEIGVEAAGEAGPGVRRDELLAPALTSLSRAIKRSLRSDQNELLAATRRSADDLASLLPAQEATGRLAEAARLGLAEALAAGRRWTDEQLGTAGEGAGGQADAEERVGSDVEPLAGELARQVIGRIREQLEHALAAGGSEEDPSRIVGAAYREWKADRVEQLSGDFAAKAFSLGLIEAAKRQGALVRWSVAAGNAPCPDCDDNALAGPQAPGSAFPTGQASPPTHPGCRCLLVPVTA